MSVKRQITTPVGEFKWAFITKSRENLSGVKQYSITLVLTPEEAKPLISEIEVVWKESGIKKPMKSAGYKTNEDGNIEFNFKTNETFADGTQNKVAVFDAKGRKVDLGDRLIGNGSRGRVKGVAATYEQGPNAGVTLYLNAIQIVKFVEYEGGDTFDSVAGSPDDFMGFETEFDGLDTEMQPDVPKF